MPGNFFCCTFFTYAFRWILPKKLTFLGIFWLFFCLYSEFITNARWISILELLGLKDSQNDVSAMGTMAQVFGSIQSIERKLNWVVVRRTCSDSIYNFMEKVFEQFRPSFWLAKWWEWYFFKVYGLKNYYIFHSVSEKTIFAHYLWVKLAILSDPKKTRTLYHSSLSSNMKDSTYIYLSLVRATAYLHRQGGHSKTIYYFCFHELNLECALCLLCTMDDETKSSLPSHW